jgi:hypothetical protein
VTEGCLFLVVQLLLLYIMPKVVHLTHVLVVHLLLLYIMSKVIHLTHVLVVQLLLLYSTLCLKLSI